MMNEDLMRLKYLKKKIEELSDDLNRLKAEKENPPKFGIAGTLVSGQGLINDMLSEWLCHLIDKENATRRECHERYTEFAYLHAKLFATDGGGLNYEKLQQQ